MLIRKSWKMYDLKGEVYNKEEICYYVSEKDGMRHVYYTRKPQEEDYDVDEEILEQVETETLSATNKLADEQEILEELKSKLRRVKRESASIAKKIEAEKAKLDKLNREYNEMLNAKTKTSRKLSLE